jgi:hypothetical protein
MIKMDMIWIAAATLIYPKTLSRQLVSESQIEEQVYRLFKSKITPFMVSKHLVSWEDRQADQENPRRGGSRNRYLFRTMDGVSPSGAGSFRLYKQIDSKYDGWEKTGRICPELEDFPGEYHYLIKWYSEHYYPST